MNTAELIYQDVQIFPESLALEVLDFVEFLKTKNQALLEQERELARKIQIGIVMIWLFRYVSVEEFLKA
jgi:hypothetical protein